MSRTGLTDAILIFEITLAMYALARDPRLDAPASRWIFGIATGAAIMTKAAAGILPLLILALSGVAPLRLVQAGAIAALIAAPWHLWQLYQHPRWFWAEYVLSEHFTWGINAPQQTTDESHIGYYLKRIVALDPVLLAAAGFAIFRTRPRVLLTWTLVVLTGAIAWRYRNVSYLGPMLPAMAILAATAIPKRYARIAVGVVAAFLLAKIFLPHQLFGIPFTAETAIPSQAALDAYASRHRGNDFIILEPDDQFYSADLDLARVRYLWLDSSASRVKMPLDFEYLGITVSAADYARLDQILPVFAQRLREWNLDSTRPVATAILARNRGEILDLIAANPQTDFLVPNDWTSPVHQRWLPSGDRVFLLSREVIQRP